MYGITDATDNEAVLKHVLTMENVISTSILISRGLEEPGEHHGTSERRGGMRSLRQRGV